jgi:hypothetical protein
MWSLRLAALVAVVAMAAPSASAAAPAPVSGRHVVLAFLPVAESTPSDPTLPRKTIIDTLDERKGLSIGLSGATQGTYTQEQALLDMTAGTRTSASAYNAKRPIALTFCGDCIPNPLLLGWPDIISRAKSAKAEIQPGLLASSLPGGAGYAGVTGRHQVEAIVAADEQGRIFNPSIGPAHNVARRGLALLADHRFVVIGLPTGDAGARQLDSLIKLHRPNELLIVMETPPDFRAPQLLPTGVLGLGSGKAKGVTSDTTHQPGLVAGIDVIATVLDYLGVKVPKAVKGQPYKVSGTRDADALTSFSARLRVVSARRFPALEAMLATWLAMILIGGVFFDQRGIRWGMRTGALAWCWLLSVLLVTGALSPSRSSELIEITAGYFGLAALTDLAFKWPRAIMVPCLVTVVVYAADLANGSHYIVRSILGPNPRSGSRFYGLGNELEATLPILLFVGLAILLRNRGPSRFTAGVFALTGIVFAGIVGSGRLGADVGGVLTVAAGAGVATLCMLPGGLTKRSITLAVLALPAGLIALAGLDLATGGDGHFTRTVLHADGKGAIWDIISRRYTLAFNVGKRGFMPFATAIAVLTLVYGIRYRERVFAPVAGNAAWRAALLGSLAAAIAGTLFNDSGPLLLMFGAFLLAVVTAYIRGDPQLATQVTTTQRIDAGAGG